MMERKTIHYYDEHATEFCDATRDLLFYENQDHFLRYLKKGDHILDFGCGAGRDTKYFLEQGYQVTATDGSEEMCRLASEFTGIDVKQMCFQQLEDVDSYDGIWACASILHIDYEALVDIFARMRRALRPEGIIYASFKLGAFSGERHERFFTDFTEQSFREFMDQVNGLVIDDIWITDDVREGRSDEKWLNVILR